MLLILDKNTNKVYIDNTVLSLQAFSFEKFAWNKENYLLEDHAGTFKENILIDDENVMK
jgi:hypothetical protein